jgi:hypothetical protein
VPAGDAALPSNDFGDRFLALERPRDAKGNEYTRPPDTECITFRSMTIVEMYAAQSIESLKSAISRMEWSEDDDPIVDRIVEAQAGHLYSRGNFWIFAEAADTSSPLKRARADLPEGIGRIYCEYFVVGPSLVAIVLTFVLQDDVASRIESALREDAESRIDRSGDSVSRKTVQDVKRERVVNIRSELEVRCRNWIETQMPGTLSGDGDIRHPSCVLLSLAEGTPFETQSGYMSVMNLVNGQVAEKFESLNFLYLNHSIGLGPVDSMTAAFNEKEALAQQWVDDLSAAPEVFHEVIAALLIADGMLAVTYSFERTLRSIRNELNELDFEKATGPEVIALRNRLLSISRDVSTVCGDIDVVLEDPSWLWSDLYPLVPVQPSSSSSLPVATADAERRQLRAAVTGIRSQEANLRELILVTSASTSETRGLELQTNILTLTKTLGRLTKWLIILTIVLVLLGAGALLAQIVHTPVVNVQVPPPAQPTTTSTAHANR